MRRAPLATMFVMVSTIIILMLAISHVEADYAEQCPGNRQKVIVPSGYDQYVPDSEVYENVTYVWLNHEIKQLRMVKEEK